MPERIRPKSHHHKSTSQKQVSAPAPRGPKPHSKWEWGYRDGYAGDLERFSRTWPDSKLHPVQYTAKAVAYGARGVFNTLGAPKGTLGGMVRGLEWVGEATVALVAPGAYREAKEFDRYMESKGRHKHKSKHHHR